MPVSGKRVYELEILLKYHRGEKKQATKGKRGEMFIIKKQGVLIQNMKRIFLLIFTFIKTKNSKENWPKNLNRHFTRDIQKLMNLWKSGKPLNSSGKWKLKPHISQSYPLEYQK